MTAPLIDPFARAINYLRVSVTDRCDLRCVYCMAEKMTFLPRKELLTLEELERLCGAFIRLGVRKLRITGGEPLVRRDVMALIRGLGAQIGRPGGLEELTLTTNGTQLAKQAEALAAAGVRRINVSMDSLDPEVFAKVTRGGSLMQVTEGLEAAKAAGIKVKINAVALKGVNDATLHDMVAWAGREGFDLAFIEVMPLGELGGLERIDQYWPLSDLRRQLESRWTITDTPYRTGGPARYVDVAETGRRIGFITPLTHNFCESCNRVRLTCTGKLYMCLGQEDSADLRAPLRAGASEAELEAAIRAAIARKPKGHDFIYERRGQAPALSRHMSVTGG